MLSHRPEASLQHFQEVTLGSPISPPPPLIHSAAPGRDPVSWPLGQLPAGRIPGQQPAPCGKDMGGDPWKVPVDWAYLKHKHLAPEESHCVEVAITDVGFGTGCGWPVPEGWPRRPGLALMLPLRRRMDPADRERGEGPCGLQGLGWGSWREGLHLRKGPAIPCRPIT